MARDLNRELLKLAAFSDDEIEAFLPQWLETAERVKIDDDTLIYARIPTSPRTGTSNISASAR